MPRDLAHLLLEIPKVPIRRHPTPIRRTPSDSFGSWDLKLWGSGTTVIPIRFHPTYTARYAKNVNRYTPTPTNHPTEFRNDSGILWWCLYNAFCWLKKTHPLQIYNNTSGSIVWGLVTTSSFLVKRVSQLIYISPHKNIHTIGPPTDKNHHWCHQPRFYFLDWHKCVGFPSQRSIERCRSCLNRDSPKIKL